MGETVGVRGMKLPNQRDIVLGDILVGANEGDLFVKGGCDKQTVKGVAVNQRQRLKGGKMRGHNGEDSNFVILYSLYKTSGITRKTQFANADFNSQFPMRKLRSHIYD